MPTPNLCSLSREPLSEAQSLPLPLQLCLFSRWRRTKHLASVTLQTAGAEGGVLLLPF